MRRCPNCGSTTFASDPPSQRAVTSGKMSLAPGIVVQPPTAYPVSTQKTFSSSIRYTLSLYGVISGRASRSEFWYFTLFYVIIYLCATMLDVSASFVMVEKESLRSFVWFGIIAWMALLLPSLSVFVRRAHDVGHSSAWYLPIFVATQAGSLFIIIGNMRVVWLIVLMWVAGIFLSYLFLARSGSSGPNRFGGNPPVFA